MTKMMRNKRSKIMKNANYFVWNAVIFITMALAQANTIVTAPVSSNI